MDGSQQCVDVTILDDIIVDNANVTFTVMLTTEDPNVVLGNNKTTIIITDGPGEGLDCVAYYSLELVLISCVIDWQLC